MREVVHADYEDDFETSTRNLAAMSSKASPFTLPSLGLGSRGPAIASKPPNTGVTPVNAKPTPVTTLPVLPTAAPPPMPLILPPITYMDALKKAGLAKAPSSASFRLSRGSSRKSLEVKAKKKKKARTIASIAANLDETEKLLGDLNLARARIKDLEEEVKTLKSVHRLQDRAIKDYNSQQSSFPTVYASLHADLRAHKQFSQTVLARLTVEEKRSQQLHDELAKARSACERAERVARGKGLEDLDKLKRAKEAASERAQVAESRVQELEREMDVAKKWRELELRELVEDKKGLLAELRACRNLVDEKERKAQDLHRRLADASMHINHAPVNHRSAASSPAPPDIPSPLTTRPQSEAYAAETRRRMRTASRVGQAVSNHRAQKLRQDTMVETGEDDADTHLKPVEVVQPVRSRARTRTATPTPTDEQAAFSPPPAQPRALDSPKAQAPALVGQDSSKPSTVFKPNLFARTPAAPARASSPSNKPMAPPVKPTTPPAVAAEPMTPPRSLVPIPPSLAFLAGGSSSKNEGPLVTGQDAQTGRNPVGELERSAKEALYTPSSLSRSRPNVSEDTGYAPSTLTPGPVVGGAPAGKQVVVGFQFGGKNVAGAAEDSDGQGDFEVEEIDSM